MDILLQKVARKRRLTGRWIGRKNSAQLFWGVHPIDAYFLI